MSAHREITVETGGERLDRLLVEASGLTRNQVRRLIDAGQVRVNGEPAQKAGMKLDTRTRVNWSEPEPEASEATAQDIPLDIRYEDPELLVLDKPAGLVVHPAAGNRDGTLVNALLHHCPDLPGIGGVIRPGIVHRLDKDTSGLMVVAKTEATLKALQAQFKAHHVTKVYRCFVYGGPRPAEGRIEAAIARHPSDRKRFAVDDTGKPAVTRYKTLGDFGDLSHLELILETGRTHQIRVHLAHLGHPIVGDRVYTPPRRASQIRDVALRRFLEGISRQLLHARELAFYHPTRCERMAFVSEPPPDMARLLAILEGRVTC